MNKNIIKMIEYPQEGILTKEIVKDKKSNVTLFCMAKNSEIGEHTSTKQGSIYVIEGKGTFNLEGKDIEMITGVYIHLKENAIHSLNAKENTSFLLVLY